MTRGQNIRLGYTTINPKSRCHLHCCYSECYCCSFCHRYSVLISALAQTYAEDQSAKLQGFYGSNPSKTFMYTAPFWIPKRDKGADY